ncbi:MAG TPA: hypothetical protein PKA41_09665 [Verrucomicrobiota bacterium]|nr:hypothetical protein [Verrucomicrobiota bacterium]
MNEFKFSCPSCNQHIKVGAEFESRRIDCPSCRVSIIVPKPLKSDKVLPVAVLAQPAARRKAAPERPAKPKPETPAPPPVEPHSPVTKRAANQPSVAPPAPVQQPAPPPPQVKTVKPISDKRIAVLTPALKLEIIRAVRPRIEDKSRWIPGKKEAGEYNYAARSEAGRLVPVSPTDASATHYSLFGAVLLEFHKRNIMRVTTGRRKFLDEELTGTIHQVLDRAPDASPVSEQEREAITHEQCLEVLDILERRYQKEAAAAKKETVESKIERVSLADLVKKMNKGAPLRAEQVASALYYELEEIKQRLDELEGHANSGG